MKTQIKKPRAALSLSATLAIAFLALSGVVLLISGGLQLFSNLQTQRDAIANKQQLIAQDAGKTVSSFIQEKFGVLDTAVRLADPVAASPEAQEQILDSLLGVQPAFRQLILWNAQDQELARASRLSQAASGQLTSQLDDEVGALIRQGQRYISPIYIDAVTSEPMVIMAVPATDAFGDFQGALLAEVNLKFMWDLVDQLQVGQTGQAYVVDRQGNLIAFSDIARVLKGENVSRLPVVAEFIRNPASVPAGVSLYPGITGATVVGAYVPLGTPDWAVVTELSWTEAYQEVIRQGLVSLGITVGMALLAGLLGFYLARRLAAPLVNLTDTAARITAGELQLQAEVAGPQEVAGLALAFNSMTAQLQQLLAGLEQQVADRTHRLEIVATLGERLSAILDLQQLLPEVVRQIQANFGYYHAHIYLLETQGEKLVVAAGTGAAGGEMQASGHSIPLNTPASLVARAARTGEIVRVDNVREAADWLPNPLLPDTYAEMAVPIMLEGQVVGVLDVQENEIAGLDDSDANLLRSLANQVAVAIRNARLFNEVEVALAQARAAQERYLEQSWARTRLTVQKGQYHYHRPEAPALAEAALAEAKQQALALDRPGLIALNGSGAEAEVQAPKAIIAPIIFQDKNIGTLHLHPANEDQAWSEDDLVIVGAVVDQLAQTAENLRLFEETRERAGREQLARQITDKIRSSRDLEAAMKTAAEELSNALNLSTARIKWQVPAADKAAEPLQETKNGAARNQAS